MNKNELDQFYKEQLIFIIIGTVVFLIIMGVLFYITINPNIIMTTINDCTREIVGNCIVK